MRNTPQEKVVWSSPYVHIIEMPGRPGEPPYHGLRQNPYVGILPLIPGGHFVVLRQYRPVLGRWTWEFPAGTVDKGVTPFQAAKQELFEETGLTAKRWSRLGAFWPDTGRLAMASYGYVAHCQWHGPVRRRHGDFDVRKVSRRQLQQMIRRGRFRHQLHLGLLGAWLFRQTDLHH
jgi:8-oxo-dGTP pyrophosphatase MutT (NUDIX family)